MSDIVDLDAFVGPPRQVKLGGKTYKFPRDIPAELYLEINELNRRAAARRDRRHQAQDPGLTMSDIVDLDAFVGPPRQVKLGGKTYKFPRDIPAELYLEINELNRRADEIADGDLITKMHADVLELLQVHQPDMTRLPASMSLNVLVRAIGIIYGAKAEEAEEDPPKPATPAAKASTGKSPKSPSRSRSTRS